MVALCEEEGSRFHANYFGSRAILGIAEGAEFDDLHDQAGVTLAQAMREVGLDPARFRESVRADHAGTTPMDARRDALQGAAPMALEIAAVGRRRGRPAVATIGKWEVRPGGANR